MTSEERGPRIISDNQVDLMNLLQDIGQEDPYQHPHQGTSSYILTDKRETPYEQLSNNTEPMMEYTQTTLTPSTPVQRSLANIEEQMATIRSKLDKKSPKVTIAQLSQKLDRIINMLRKNGITE